MLNGSTTRMFRGGDDGGGVETRIPSTIAITHTHTHTHKALVPSPSLLPSPLPQAHTRLLTTPAPEAAKANLRIAFLSATVDWERREKREGRREKGEGRREV